MRLAALLVGSMVLASGSAVAQNTRPAEYEYADAKLNATYRNLLARLSAADAVALRKAQRSWIAFRDADCTFGWAERFDCLIQRTDEREEQLQNSLYFDRKGTVIKLPHQK